MTSLEVDWTKIHTLSGDPLKREVFSILQNASYAVQTAEPDNPQLLEIIPRLAEVLQEKPELHDFRTAYSSLARAVGLWNYIDKESADVGDKLVAEALTAPALDGITFHREQIAALNILFKGTNLILSAPTSFGKSILIDALIASGKYNRIVIILPTIALLDEFRRRLGRRFGDKFAIVMHQSEGTREKRVIFLGTQERLLNRKDLGSIDITVVDEFYKLDPNRRDDRSITLNAAVYKLLARSRQFFFLGPNIDSIELGGKGRWSFEFLHTKFATVAVDTIDMSRTTDKKASLFNEIADDARWPALVFVSAPDKANSLAVEAAAEVTVSDEGSEFADWLQVNVGPRWPIVKAVRDGFGIHHGRIPRAIASQMVRMFNDSRLPVLFCTSTLIEGVNTSAKSVMIFDKKIDRRDYDFFTFSNIRGRAGRLGRHHVGQVLLYNIPPIPDTTEVSPTLFGDEETAPDDYLAHLTDEDISDRSEERVLALANDLGLDRDELRVAASIGLEKAAELKQMVRNRLRKSNALVWRGFPKYENIYNLCEVVCHVNKASTYGASSFSQLAKFIGDLSRASSLREFLNEYDRSFRSELKFYDSIFKFLRACEYGLPQIFAVVEMFVRADGRSADYSLLLREISRWYRPECLKELEEEGIPIQISERIYSDGDTRASILNKLRLVTEGNFGDYTDFERRWLRAAFDFAMP
jgi:hypothetical protein